YYFAAAPAEGGGYGIWRGALSGGSPEVLVSQGSFYTQLIVSQSCIYFIDSGGGGHTLGRGSKTGGTPVTLATESSPGVRIALDDQYLYWAGLQSGNIGKVHR